jgi:succinate dehydrogenase/fumarate reductase flavoprotein subunit
MNVDVVVIGSGAAGLTAATVAAHAGLKVLVLEKTSYLGGTTAFSAGGLWVPNNRHQKERGFEDDPEKAMAYARALLGNVFEAEKIETYLAKSVEMVDWMEANTEVAFFTNGSSDYEMGLPGATFGRTLVPPPFDGTRLGPDLQRMRPPLPQASVFGTMQIGYYGDIGHVLNAHRAWPSFRHTTGLVLRFLKEWTVHGRGARLANGNALAGRLVASARAAGVILWTDTPAKGLVLEGGAVRGVVAARDGIDVTISARQGVVLASGGFGANPDLRAKHIPLAGAGWSLQPEGNEGDGISMGEAAGGVFRTDNVANGIWCPMSAMSGPDGRLVPFPHLFLDRHCPGSLMVTDQGRRFVNESTHYQNIGNLMIADGIERCWLVADHRAQRRYGMGHAKPEPYPTTPYVRAGYLKRGRTVRELAAQIGIDPDTLDATVTEFNRHAAHGEDPAFQRGEDLYARGMGDPTHEPNPCLAPLEQAPFYAIEIRPGDLSSVCGLDTDVDARVLDRSGAPIEGLYAAGLDANTIFRGTYPGGGASLGPAMTFGYLAARHIAARAAQPAAA